MTPRDITGKRFTSLVALKMMPERIKKRVMWLCICDCGNTIITSHHDLSCRDCQSCGCRKKNVLGNLVRLEYGLSAYNQLFSSYIRHAKNRGLIFDLTKEEFSILTKGNCFYCGVEPKQMHKVKSGYGEYVYNGVDRVDSSKGYSLDNCVPCCGMCNYAKNNTPKEDFLAWISRVYEHQILNVGKSEKN